MTHLWTRAALVAFSAGALAACQSPNYATREGYTPPPPLEQQRPQYPTRADEAPMVEAPPPPSVSASPSTSVESSDLPPPSAAPAEMARAEPEPPPPAPPPPPEPPPPEPVRYEPPPPAAPPPPRMIPTATGRVVSVSGQTQSYTVRSGDSVDRLAREHDTSRRVIVELNDLEEPYRLRPGQRLRLPAPDRRAYVVVSGDTLYQVSRRFSVRVNELRAANNLGANSQIRAGQRLILPAGHRDLGPQRRPDTSQQASAPSRPPAARPSPPPVRAAAPPPAPQPTRVAAAEPPRMPSAEPPPPRVTTAPPPPRTEPVPPPTTRPNPGGLSVQQPSRPAPSVANPTPSRPVTQRPSSGANIAGAPPSVPSSGPVPDGQIATLGRGRFIWPLSGNILSTYGPKPGGRRNDGIDISGLDGMVVRAAAAGEIVYAGDQVPGFGNLVLIKHADGWVTAYAHLGRVSVQMRQMVQQGQEIGSVGRSGGVTEPQLHFEVRYAPTPADRARPVDPSLVLPQR